MRLKGHLMLQTGIAEDVHAAHSIGQKEQIICVVPRDLVYFKAERLLHSNFVCSRIDKRDQVFFVAHSDCFSVRRPGYVYVLALCICHRNTFSHTDVPDAHSLVSACCTKLIWIRFVPTQLIHGRRVTAKNVALHKAIALQGVYCDSFVKRS